MMRITTTLLSLALASQIAMQPAQAETVLRLSGSNTIGQRLVADLAKTFSTKAGFPVTRIENGADPEAYDVVSTRSEDDNALRIKVEAQGTGTGAIRLLGGAADFWMASRQARQSDLDGVRAQGILGLPKLDELLSEKSEHTIALDALRIIVSPNNPVRTLTVAQLRQIYVGEVRNWAAVGGPNAPIALYGFGRASGNFDSFCGLVMGITNGDKCQKEMAPLAASFKSNEDLSDAVASDPAGIGYVGFGYQRSAKGIAISTNCGTTVQPNAFSVKADEYPLARRLYFYSAGPLTEMAAKFLQFVESDEAQTVIEGAGFIDFRAANAPENYATGRLETAGNALDNGRTKIRPREIQAFEDNITGATRLPITFRFQAGSDALDSRSVTDLSRLAATMKTKPFATSELILIGFTQAQGDYEANRETSRERAKLVADRLSTGFSVKAAATVGVGPTAPVACNLDPEARWLNQRVEAWVRPGK